MSSLAGLNQFLIEGRMIPPPLLTEVLKFGTACAQIAIYILAIGSIVDQGAEDLLKAGKDSALPWRKPDPCDADRQESRLPSPSGKINPR
jgi:hypothetical protein